jgi:hypothetical protein
MSGSELDPRTSFVVVVAAVTELGVHDDTRPMLCFAFIYVKEMAHSIQDLVVFGPYHFP